MKLAHRNCLGLNTRRPVFGVYDHSRLKQPAQLQRVHVARKLKYDSKFGQKLMEKMGWSKGKGLGANEDGKTEHVKVSLKTDNRGVGCTKKDADNWIAHQDDFNALLANLSQNHGSQGNSSDEDAAKVSSLEHKSKTSRGRVHYHKFTKGKDLSSRSTTDLDCVFGKRRNQSENNTPVNQSEANSDASDTDNQTHGLNTVKSSDSVQEYFAKKMAERMAKLKGKDVESLDVYTESADREDLKLISNDCDNVESLDASENIDLDRKKKKRSKKDKTKKDFESLDVYTESADKDLKLINNDCDNVESFDASENIDLDMKKKKRSKKDKTKKDKAEVLDKSEELLEKNEESNVNRDKLMDKSEELIDDSDCYEKSEKTKKKSRKSKKFKTDKSTDMVEGDEAREEADEVNIEAQSKSKKKKDQSDSKVSGKKRKRSTDDVEALNEEQEEADEGNSEAQSMGKKKKKSKKMKNDVSEKLGERTELSLKDNTDLIDKENKMKYLQDDSEKSVTKEDACSSQASSFVTDFSQSDDKAPGRKRMKSVKFFIEEESETLREEVEIHENQSVNKKNKKSEKKRKEMEENVARDNKPQGQETVEYGGDPQASKMKRLSVFPKKNSTKKQKIETIEEGKKSGNQVKVGVVAQHKTKRNRKPKSRKKKEIVRESRTNSGHKGLIESKLGGVQNSRKVRKNSGQKDLSESKLGGVLNSKEVRKNSGQKDLSKSKLGGVRNSKEVRKNSGQKDLSKSKLGGVPNSRDIKKSSGQKDLSEIKLDDLWYSRQEIKLGGVSNSSDVKKNDSGPIGLLINNFGVDQDTLDSGSAFRGSNLSKVKGYIGLNKATIMLGLERKRQKMGFRNRAFNHPIPNAKKMGFRNRAFDHPIPNAKKHVKFPI